MLNSLQTEALGILQEEAAEVIQEASKVRRTGPEFCRRGTHVSNMEHFQMEVQDFLILLELCEKAGVYIRPTKEWEDNYRVFKHDKLRKWSNLGDLVNELQGISERTTA